MSLSTPQKILYHVGLPLSEEKAPPPDFRMDNLSVRQLSDFLQKTNGLVAFESALIIRPVTATELADDITTWNRLNRWKGFYDSPEVHETLFFVEDAFGFQFGIRHDGTIVLLDVETGQLDPFCNCFDEWIEMILDDSDLHTGYPVMHEWQLANGPIPPRCRLRPPIPFVMGGEFDAENMRAIPIGEIMRFGADLARQIKDVPDGGHVRIIVTNE